MDERKDKMITEEYKGVSQYRRPLDFELTGKTFNIALDNGKDFLLELLTDETLRFSYENITELQTYECLKGTDSIYLIHFERKGQQPRKAITLVVDLTTRLVTANFATQGANQENSRLVEREIIFGAIRNPGKPLPQKRHEYTQELIGKKIEWFFNPEFSVIHIYHAKDRYRGCFSEAMKKRVKDASKLPAFIEEPSVYIKISDKVYVFSFIEKNSKGGTMEFMLMDEARLIASGLFFGINPEGKPESYTFSAYGKYVTDTVAEE